MDKIRKIAKCIDEYAKKAKSPDYGELITYVTKNSGQPRLVVEDVVKFLQELQGVSAVPAPLEAINIDMSKPLDLGHEIHFNYAVAKALLERTLNTTLPDSEEIRKTLREINKFLETMLKMQERVYNVQEIQKFQEAVFEVLNEHALKDVIVGRLLEISV